MVNMEKVLEAVSPLPLTLRDRILSNLSRIVEEAKARERPENEINRLIIDAVLVDLYSNLIEPLEMIEKTLASKPLREISTFKIEFSEVPFNMHFLDETYAFREEFWTLAEKLGRREALTPKKPALDWKGESSDELV